MTPNYHEGTTKRKYCHEGATKQAQTTTKCHEKVPQFPPQANASLGRGSAFAQKSNSELRKNIDA